MKKLKILFLGDSVTDSHHSTHDDPYGDGYVSMIYNHLNCTLSLDELKIVNSGFNGHRSKDLLERIDKLLEEEFTHIYILIGVNDSWRKFDHNDETPVNIYQQNLKKLLSIILTKSKAKVFLMSPFVLKINELTQNISLDLKPKQKAMKQIAALNNLEFINLQKEFNHASKIYKKQNLAQDGIHPTILGHSLIAMSVLNSIFK